MWRRVVGLFVVYARSYAAVSMAVAVARLSVLPECECECERDVTVTVVVVVRAVVCPSVPSVSVCPSV